MLLPEIPRRQWAQAGAVEPMLSGEWNQVYNVVYVVLVQP